MSKNPKTTQNITVGYSRDYGLLISDISRVLDAARHASARAVNSVLTSTYWEIGRRIVEFEQEVKRGRIMAKH